MSQGALGLTAIYLAGSQHLGSAGGAGHAVLEGADPLLASLLSNRQNRHNCLPPTPELLKLEGTLAPQVQARHPLWRLTQAAAASPSAPAHPHAGAP